MARDIKVLLKEFNELQAKPGYDCNMRDVWYSLLESEEQLALWAALCESLSAEAQRDEYTRYVYESLTR